MRGFKLSFNSKSREIETDTMLKYFNYKSCVNGEYK